MKYMDMHVHTTASDGVFSPAEIVRWGIKLGLEGIAITDHDTVDGIEEGILAKENHSDFIIIPGIEFSTIYKEFEIHILGYFIDCKNENLIDITKKIKSHRVTRAEKMIQKLQKMNVEINFSDVLDLCEGKTIGRPHIARVLINKGYVSSIQEAFEKYLGKGKGAYVKRFKLEVIDAIQIIEKAGGTPVLAHPGLLDHSIDIKELIDKGIKGIEVYHTKHAKEDKEYFFNLATKHKLFITGGTDFHDTTVDEVPTLGRITIPFSSIVGMKKQ